MSDRTGRFVAGAMVAVGTLIAAVAGPCTLYYGGGALFALFRGEVGSGLVLVASLLVGGLPTAVGAGLAIVGWRRLSR